MLLKISHHVCRLLLFPCFLFYFVYHIGTMDRNDDLPSMKTFNENHFINTFDEENTLDENNTFDESDTVDKNHTFDENHAFHSALSFGSNLLKQHGRELKSVNAILTAPVLIFFRFPLGGGYALQVICWMNSCLPCCNTA